MTAIETQALTKHYGSVVAVEDFHVILQHVAELQAGDGPRLKVEPAAC